MSKKDVSGHPKYRRPFNFTLGSKWRDREECDCESMTEPGQAMSVRTIYERFVMRGDIDIGEGYYNSEDDFPDVIKMDKIQIAEYQKRLQETIVKARDELKANEELKKKAAYQKKLAEEVAKKLEAIEKADVEATKE